VEGTQPVQQGSMKYIGHGRIIHTKSVKLMAWRVLIAHAAKQAGCTPVDGPIIISMRFRLKRPKTVKRLRPTVPPDLDKLVRAVNDGLTGVAFTDDSQIVQITASKEYSDISGVDIELDCE